MNIFIDFDDTLIDTTRLLRDCLNAFDGVSGESLKETYDRLRAHQGFDLSAFAAEVELMHGIAAEEVIRRMNALVACTRNYCFEDSRAALQALKQKGHKLILVTHATDAAWQWKKIHASGLYDLFDDIQITTRPKVELIRELTQESPFVFIDDRPEHVTATQRAFPKAQCFLKAHDNKTHELEQDLPCIHSLSELLERLSCGVTGG